MFASVQYLCRWQYNLKNKDFLKGWRKKTFFPFAWIYNIKTHKVTNLFLSDKDIASSTGNNNLPVQKCLVKASIFPSFLKLPVVLFAHFKFTILETLKFLAETMKSMGIIKNYDYNIRLMIILHRTILGK